MGETLPYRDTSDKTVDKFGWSVSLSSDGKRLAVGASNSSGRVFVYSYDYDWKDITEDIDGLSIATGAPGMQETALF